MAPGDNTGGTHMVMDHQHRREPFTNTVKNTGVVTKDVLHIHAYSVENVNGKMMLK